MLLFFSFNIIDLQYLLDPELQQYHQLIVETAAPASKFRKGLYAFLNIDIALSLQAWANLLTPSFVDRHRNWTAFKLFVRKPSDFINFGFLV